MSLSAPKTCRLEQPRGISAPRLLAQSDIEKEGSSQPNLNSLPMHGGALSGAFAQLALSLMEEL